VHLNRSKEREFVKQRGILPKVMPLVSSTVGCPADAHDTRTIDDPRQSDNGEVVDTGRSGTLVGVAYRCSK